MVKFEMPKESMYFLFPKDYSIFSIQIDELDSIGQYYHLTTLKIVIAYIIIVIYLCDA